MGSVGCTAETTSTFQPWREGKYTQWLGKINDLPRLRMGFCKKDAVLIATHHLYHLDDSSKFFPTKSSMQTQALFEIRDPHLQPLKKKDHSTSTSFSRFPRLSHCFNCLGNSPFFNQNNSSIKSLFFRGNAYPTWMMPKADSWYSFP